MNDEIKEILLKIQNVVNHKVASYNALVETKAEDYKILLDYITNLQHQISLMEEDIRESKEINGELQQENERLKENNQSMQEEMARVWEENERLKEYFDIMVKFIQKNLDRFCDYKSRCEKASEYIDNFWREKSYYESVENCLKFATMNEFEKEDLLNTLQNGSDSQ